MAGALGDHFAERIRVIPRTQHKVLVGAVDPSRPEYEIRAILDIRNGPVEAMGAGDRTGARGPVLVPLIRLSIERAKVVAPNALPVAGDEIVALEQTQAHPAGARFRVSPDSPLGGSFVDFHLMPIPE